MERRVGDEHVEPGEGEREELGASSGTQRNMLRCAKAFDERRRGRGGGKNAAYNPNTCADVIDHEHRASRKPQARSVDRTGPSNNENMLNRL